MSEPSRWRFGPFVADATEHLLLRDGRPVPLTRKAFALLLELIKRAGRLSTKDELFSTVWAGTVVTDASLSRAIRELRVVLDDDANAPRYIATAHGLGFRFMAEVAADTPRTQRAAQAVGREAELAQLQQALAAALNGQRQLVLVTGAAGVGKTALVEAFIAESSAVGGWLAQGRCIETFGTGEPYGPVLEAMDSLARQVGAAEMAAMLLRCAPAWLAQLPWLAHEVDPQALQRASAGATAQRMLREATTLLESLAAQRPLLLWLEDLHWSDPSTLELLAYLGGRRESSRLIVVASLRAGEAASPGLAALQQGAHRGQVRNLPLGLLDEASVADLLRQRVPPGAQLPVAALAQFIHHRTEGHALFAVALIEDLVRRSLLQPGPDGWQLAVPVHELGLGLPDSLRQLVRLQVDQLDEPSRRVIEAAAVAGADFDAASVAAALGCEIAEVEERALRLLHAGRLLRHRPAVRWPDGTEAAGFGFAHALVWQGVYEDVAPARRVEWQRAVAERIEQAWGEDAAPVAAELAMRFEAAHEPVRALMYLAQAGQSALQRCAYREGEEHLQHALTLVGELPAAQRERRELELQFTLGAAQMALHGYGSADVEATYRRALALCRRVARPGELERTLRGQWNVALVRAELDEAQLAADELVLQASAAGDRSAAFDAFAKLGQTAMHRGEFAAARRHLEHALALPVPVRDAVRMREAPRVLAYLAWVLWHAGQGDRALARSEEALAMAAEAGSAHTSAFVLGFAGWLHVFRGEPQRMQALAQQQAALALEHGLVYWKVWSDALLGLAQARLAATPAEAAAGRAAMGDALQAFAAQGSEVGVSHFLSTLGEVALQAGDLAGAEQALQRSAALLDRNGNAYQAPELLRLQGELARRRGDAALAQTRLDAALRQARLQGARALELRAACSLAALWREEGRAEAVGALLTPLRNGFDAGGHAAELAQLTALLGSPATQAAG